MHYDKLLAKVFLTCMESDRMSKEDMVVLCNFFDLVNESLNNNSFTMCSFNGICKEFKAITNYTRNQHQSNRNYQD
jgi:hypothetical protein